MNSKEKTAYSWRNSSKPKAYTAFRLPGGLPGGISGAPNENIVQNHLNIALLNVF